MLMVLIPLTDVIAPFGTAVDNIALVLFSKEKDINTFVTVLPKQQKIK